VISDNEIFVDENAKYIKIDDVAMKDIESVWGQLAASYQGFTVDFCFYDTISPEKFLLAKGAAILDNCIIMRLSEKDFVDMPTKEALQATKENFAAFVGYHDEENPNMYWNSERLLADFASWDIFTTSQDGEITGYALMHGGWDIRCLAAAGLEGKIALLSAAAKKSFATQDKEVVFMAGRDDYVEIGAATHLGFRHEGYYISYRVKL